MAPKRPSPSDQPPSSVSISEDEIEGTEGEESESESEEEKTPKPIQSSNPNNKPVEEEEEEEESGSDSDSDSDSDNEPVQHMVATVKPISSKPMVDTQKSTKKPISSKPIVDTPKSTKKPTSTSTSTSSAAVKRPLEIGDNNDKDSKKKKKIADIEERKSGEEKKLFQRIFSEKDEIDVLNGLLEFKNKGNKITNSALSEFYNFLKGSVNIGAHLSQIINKVHRLHNKYRKNAKRAKPGAGHPTISNPHELKSYLLSKEIWDDQIFKEAEENKSGGVIALKKSKSNLKSNGLLAISPKVVDLMEEDNIIGSQYQYLDQSLKPQNSLSLPMPPADFGEITAKDGWDKLGSSKAQAFDQRWKALIIKEAEVYLERVELVQEQTKWMLDMHESSES